MTFYWHDYETFGINPSRDRPSQFAGVRTDTDLNVIGDPLTVYCQPAIDVLPSPMACLITGITPQLAREKGVVEADFIRQIHQQLSQPGTCGVGYNSIRFDDEVTRYTLYRNFYDPYAREWQNGCSRWDIIDLVRMTYALRPDGIEWPLSEKGNPSFRLELLTKANGIAHESAHDALSDVYATIEMARLVKKAQPKLFNYLLDNRGKNQVLGLINVRGREPLVHTTRMYPTEFGCTSLVVPVGFESRNKSSLLVYDLRYAPEEFLALDVTALRNRIFISREDLPDGANRLPVKSLKVNKCPAVAPVSTLSDEAAERIQLDKEACARHREVLLQNPGFLEKIKEAYEGNVFPPSGDVDSALYEGFFGEGDKTQIDRIRQSSSADLAGAMFNFSDSRLEELLFRYRARNWPDSLSTEEQGSWSAHCQTRYQDPSYGLDPYFEELATLKEEYEKDPRAISVLEALESWGDVLISS